MCVPDEHPLPFTLRYPVTFVGLITFLPIYHRATGAIDLFPVGPVAYLWGRVPLLTRSAFTPVCTLFPVITLLPPFTTLLTCLRSNTFGCGLLVTRLVAVGSLRSGVHPLPFAFTFLRVTTTPLHGCSCLLRLVTFMPVLPYLCVITGYTTVGSSLPLPTLPGRLFTTTFAAFTVPFLHYHYPHCPWLDSLMPRYYCVPPLYVYICCSPPRFFSYHGYG